MIQVNYKNGSKTSRFIVVDLAGSERTHKNTNENQKLQEQIVVNNSFSSLARVIGIIKRDKDRASVNDLAYHDSKLTQVLSNQLNSKSSIAFLVNVYPIDNNYEETLLSLQYVERFVTFEKVASKGFLENFSMGQDTDKILQRLN